LRRNLVRQPDGKIGFEFEAKKGAKGRGTRPGRAATALRVLGPHPKDKQPVELHQRAIPRSNRRRT
jgi:hypothetical protein